MGQAKNRGTFEDRKMQAKLSGRTKLSLDDRRKVYEDVKENISRLFIRQAVKSWVDKDNKPKESINGV